MNVAIQKAKCFLHTKTGTIRCNHHSDDGKKKERETKCHDCHDTRKNPGILLLYLHTQKACIRIGKSNFTGALLGASWVSIDMLDRFRSIWIACSQEGGVARTCELLLALEVPNLAAG